MNEVNKTLFIPLYGKSKVSKQNIILHDPDAERIWEAEKFPINGKSKSKWLAYNMAMRARVFDDWTDLMLEQNPDALTVIFLGSVGVGKYGLADTTSLLSLSPVEFFAVTQKSYVLSPIRFSILMNVFSVSIICKSSSLSSNDNR